MVKKFLNAREIKEKVSEIKEDIERADRNFQVSQHLSLWNMKLIVSFPEVNVNEHRSAD